MDTTVTADGSPGPYLLGRLFVDTATVKIFRPDSGYLPPFTYISSVNGILFSDPVDSGALLKIHYETDYYGLPKIYTFYEKRYHLPSDTTLQQPDSFYRPEPLLKRDNLTVSGYKTIGVSMGSFGQLNLEQGLDVRIGGEIRPGTELSAHLNDQGTSLDGTTREISEFDMIYIALSDPRFGVVAGDQYIHWPFKGILEGQKKIKGITASVSPKIGTFQAFGALAGGNFTVQTWKGDGGQGPYSFTGNGEAGLITPIGGTIRVTVNGNDCEEGEEKQYVIDYDLGTMTFTPRLLIKPEDLIRVEYEYKLFEYQRTLVGAAASTTAGDSVLKVQGVLWSEIDNKRNPIELLLTEKDQEELESCGDDPPMSIAADSISYLDVFDEIYAATALYRKKDSAGTIFVFERPNPEKIEKNTGFYHVTFRQLDSCNDYRERRTEDNITYYEYVGPCRGTHSPLTPLSAPQRLTSGELRADLTLPLLQATIDVAGQERDRNLFSSADDDDNLASAAAVTALLGKKRFDKRSLWLSGKGNFWSKRFDREALSAFDRKSSWNDYSLQEKRVQRQTWETFLGGTPFSDLSTEFTYGQQRANTTLLTDKVGNTSRYYPLSWLHLDYTGTYFRHFSDAGNGTGHRQNGGTSLHFKKHTGSIFYRDEWRLEPEGGGAGLIEGEVTYAFLPLHLTEGLTFTQFRKGEKNLFSALDTGTALVWNQTLDCKPFRWWKIHGLSTWQSRKNIDPSGQKTSSTLLIDLKSETSSRKEVFVSQQHYRTTAEKATRFIQIPTYVGEGKGTHRYDSLRREYVEDLHGGGNFIVTQRDIYDSTNSFRMRKTTMSINWELTPPQNKIEGILGDLSWEGLLYCEEHIDATVTRFSSWFPGYLSLRNLGNQVIAPSKIRYSDLSYRQHIKWNPSFNKSLRGRFTIAPDYRQIRSYRERGINGTLSIGHRTKKISLNNELRLYWLFHDDTTSNYDRGDYYLRDINATFIQAKPVFTLFDIHLKESIGWARQDAADERTISKPIDSTTYFQITPGVTWFIRERGRVEANYTFSLVNLPSEHDYRIASGFSSGISHLITVTANVKIGKYFSLNGSYRGEIFRKKETGFTEPNRHVLSIEVQAFL